MNIHSAAPTDPDAFLRWNEGREGRREFVNGRVVEMMTGASWGHARRVRQLARLLEDRLDSTVYEVATTDIGVRTQNGIRYPDVLVDRTGNDPESLIARAPVLILEVLSPSSVAIDMVEKAAEYKELPTLQAYIVLSQRDPNSWIWLRQEDGWSGPNLIAGLNENIEVPFLGLSLPSSDVYPDFRAE